MATGPRTLIQAPPAQAPRFGLLASIPATTDQGDRWTTGISYSPEGCGTGELFDGCDYGSPVTEEDRPGIVEWDPYILSVEEGCSTFSNWDESAARVLRKLNNIQEILIGNELWNGTHAQATAGSPNTWLADGTDPSFVELSSGTGVDLVHALACLEQYLANHNGGQQGVIHATVQTVAHWESFRLLRREGNNILTFKDTLVIASPGYTGTDPDGDVATGNVWAYATDMPRIFLGEIQPPSPISAAADRVNNTIRLSAQRFALAEWQRCRHAGIQMDITVCGNYY